MMAISCTPSRPPVLIADTDFRRWDRNEPAYIFFTPPDTFSKTDLFLVLRCTDSYGFDGLRLSVETQAPSGTFWRDTVTLSCREENEGEVAVSGTASKDYRFPYLQNVKFGQPGTYRFRFAHLMPDSLLAGIAGIGIEFQSTSHGKRQTQTVSGE